MHTALSLTVTCPQPTHHSCFGALLNRWVFKLFPEGSAKLRFFLLGCTSGQAPWGLLLRCQHYLHALPSCCLPGVVVGLWDREGSSGLHTHLLGLLVVPPSRCSGLSPPVGRGQDTYFSVSHTVMGVVEPGPADPGHNHQERRRLSMPHSPGRIAG